MFKIMIPFLSVFVLTDLSAVAQNDNMLTVRGKKIAILASDGFEQSELLEPKKALEDAFAKTTIVSLKPGVIRSWTKDNWGSEIKVDATVDDVTADQFDALLLPGGTMNPDKLRVNPKAVKFVKSFADTGKPIAAICHGPWTLVEANVVKGRRLTSWPSLKTDITNAGGKWEDAEVVVDQGLVTSRKPDDLPAFNKKMLDEFAKGKAASKVVGSSK